MIEIWKDVVGYEGLYQVSNLGNVKSLTYANQYKRNKKEKSIIPHINHRGYLTVSIGYKPRATKLIHRLVAEAFIPNSKNKPQVNHKDGNKQNNCVDNLEWCTNEYNMNHAKENGLLDKRTKKLKKPINQYDLNGIFIKTWDSAKDAHRSLNIDSNHIRECCRGEKSRKTAGGYIWREANEN